MMATAYSTPSHSSRRIISTRVMSANVEVQVVVWDRLALSIIAVMCVCPWILARTPTMNIVGALPRSLSCMRHLVSHPGTHSFPAHIVPLSPHVSFSLVPACLSPPVAYSFSLFLSIFSSGGFASLNFCVCRSHSGDQRVIVPLVYYNWRSLGKSYRSEIPHCDRSLSNIPQSIRQSLHS